MGECGLDVAGMNPKCLVTWFEVSLDPHKTIGTPVPGWVEAPTKNRLL